MAPKRKADTSASSSSASLLTADGCARLGRDAPFVDTLVLRVAAVHRYPVSDVPTFRRLCVLEEHSGRALAADAPGAPSAAALSEAYDVVLTDGSSRRKAVLAPRFAEWVRAGLVRAGTVLVVRHHPLRYDETTLSAEPLVVLNTISVAVDEADVDLGAEVDEDAQAVWRDGLAALPWAAGASDHEQRHAGLVGRGVYIRVFTDEVDAPVASSGAIASSSVLVHDEAWRLADANGDATLPTIAELVADAGTKVLPALVGRVLKKTKLHRHKSQTSHKSPVSFQLELGDASSTIAVVVWNTLAIDVHDGVRVDDVLCIRNYRLKRHNLTNAWEVSCNAANPRAEITRLARFHYAGLEARFPRVEFRIVDVSSLAMVPDDVAFDVAARIVRVGSLMRGVSPKGSTFEYRWLQLADTSAANAIVHLQLFSNGMPDFAKLRAGQVALLTNVNAFSLTTDSAAPRRLYLKSTFDTQLLTGSAVPTAAALKKVQVMARFTRLRDDQYIYHAFQGNLAAFHTVFPTAAPTPLADVPDLFARMVYRESRTLVVHARIVDAAVDKDGNQALVTLEDLNGTVAATATVDAPRDADPQELLAAAVAVIGGPDAPVPPHAKSIASAEKAAKAAVKAFAGRHAVLAVTVARTHPKTPSLVIRKAL